MADVVGTRVRSPLAETTNRANSALPPHEQHHVAKPRYDHVDAPQGPQAYSHIQAHAQAPAQIHAQAPVQTYAASQVRFRHVVPTLRVENKPVTSHVIRHVTRPTAHHAAASPRTAPVLNPPKPVEGDKRLSQASYASSSSSRSRKTYKTHVGPWQLGRTLGKGSSARVRKCRHSVTNQLAAVKIVNRRMANLVQDSSLAALSEWDNSLPVKINGELRVPMSIEREVAILKLIEHPNIMKLYDIWENRSEIYLILEYIDQGDLFTYINREGPLAEKRAIYYFRQMISAIAYCHSFNVCHRDLKPENILITAEDQIKIADFGMAALHQTNDHQLVTACGSPHYAAPELLENKRYRGDRADIWSLGVILYAMLSATLPFDDPSIRYMMEKTKKGQYQMPEGLSPEAQDLIRRMLQVNPDRRINLKDIWRHPLVQKYTYLDNFGDITGQLPHTRNGFQYTPVRRHEIDDQLLRQLRSMWHKFSEEDLVRELSSDKPNDQKAFYWLLYNYRNKQLEDFKPELAHSMSDYHHLKPTIWKKKVSTCEFTQPRANGHGRSFSRFTVISTTADTEAETDKSYDPYRGSRMLHNCPSEASHAKIIIHRDTQTTTNVVATPRARSSTNSRRTRSNSAKTASIKARQPSRGSLVSLRSNRQGASHVVPVLRHKRGVDFSRARRRPASAGGSQRPPSRRRTTASVAGDGSMYRMEMDRSPTPALPKLPGGTHPKAKGAPYGRTDQKSGASTIFNEELRHFSMDCAKNCDEAFKTTLMGMSSVGGSWTDSEKKRHGSTPRSTALDSPMTATPATEVSAASWQTRPLPPLPSDGASEHYLAPSLADFESQLVLVDGETDSLAEGGARIAQPAMVCKQADRRAVSAPLYNQSPARKLSTLPSILENATVVVDGDGTRVVSAPPHNRAKKAREMARNMEYLSKVENTIRVVHSPGSGSPVKAPPPLNVRKTSAAEDWGRKLHRQLAYSAEAYDDDAVESSTKEDDSTIKKKKSWFKRSSKMESDSSVGEQKRSRGLVALKRSPSEIDAAIDAAKKVFSLSFWKSHRVRDTGMTVEGTLEEMMEPEGSKRRWLTRAAGPVKAARDSQVVRGTRPRRHQMMRNSGSGSIRSIAVKQNWLARLFRVKPAISYICMTLSRKRARQEVAMLLRGWRRYGIKDICVDRQRDVVFSRLGAKNYLNLSEVEFAAEVMTVIEHGNKQPLSIVRFTQERGAASSLHRIVDTMRLMFDSRHMVVTNRNKQKMMIKTLNA